MLSPSLWVTSSPVTLSPNWNTAAADSILGASTGVEGVEGSVGVEGSLGSPSAIITTTLPWAIWTAPL